MVATAGESFPGRIIVSLFRVSADKVIKDKAPAGSRTSTKPTGLEKNRLSVSRRLSQTESRHHTVSWNLWTLSMKLSKHSGCQIMS